MTHADFIAKSPGAHLCVLTPSEIRHFLELFTQDKDIISATSFIEEIQTNERAQFGRKQ